MNATPPPTPRLQRYARYLESLQEAGVEQQPGCEACTPNRLMLEQAWQVRARTCVSRVLAPGGWVRLAGRGCSLCAWLIELIYPQHDLV